MDFIRKTRLCAGRKAVLFFAAWLFPWALCTSAAAADSLAGRTAAADSLASSYIFPDSSDRELTERDLEGLPVQVVAYGRYEIYARRGMLFKSRELQEYFGQKEWYFGFLMASQFKQGMLNETEQKNADLFEKMEKEMKTGGYVLDCDDYNFDTVTEYITSERVAADQKVQAAVTFQPAPETKAPETETKAPETKAPEMKAPETETKAPETQALDYSREYIFPDVDSRYLTYPEVAALDLQQACYAKNEIYARHGRKFVSVELQQYFGGKSWYNPIIDPDDFTDLVFNEYERANLQLIVEREKELDPNLYQLDQPGYDITKAGTASYAGLAGQADSPASGADSQFNPSGQPSTDPSGRYYSSDGQMAAG